MTSREDVKIKEFTIRCDFCAAHVPTKRWSIPPGTPLWKNLATNTIECSNGDIGTCDACEKIVLEQLDSARRLADRFVDLNAVFLGKPKEERAAIRRWRRRLNEHVLKLLSNPRPFEQDRNPLDGKAVTWEAGKPAPPEAGLPPGTL